MITITTLRGRRRNLHRIRTIATLPHRRLSWLLAFALWFGACAPLMSHMVESRFSAPSTDICGTNDGAEAAGLAATQPAKADQALMKFDSCAFCALLHHAPPLPVTLPPWQALSFWFKRTRQPRAVCRGYKRFRRRAHRSRAPPSSAAPRA
ncbi:DUF2946 domain-containing protein [Paraburkholderia bannensis]|uniref:DUF2946 domain-containing protein n=1 Tax=Paraburkholderia TaxID=1822464 RepID=UPI00160AB957